MLRQSMAALAVTGITLLATPIAAYAAPALPAASECGVGSDNYANPSVVTADRTVLEGGETVNVTWEDGYFMPGTPVTVVTEGSAAGGSQLASGGASASGSMSGVSSATGSLAVAVTAGSDATGSMTITGFSDCGVGGVTVQVVDTSSAALTDTDDADTLAFTGSSIPVVLLVTGAGAVAFGSILLAARARGRRRTQE